MDGGLSDILIHGLCRHRDSGLPAAAAAVCLVEGVRKVLGQL